jgi:nitrate reductase NapE component
MNPWTKCTENVACKKEMCLNTMRLFYEQQQLALVLCLWNVVRFVGKFGFSVLFLEHCHRKIGFGIFGTGPDSSEN